MRSGVPVAVGPRGTLPERLAEHPAADAGDRAGLLGERDELHRRDEAARRGGSSGRAPRSPVVRAVGEQHGRLVVDLELAGGGRAGEVLGQVGAPAGGLGHAVGVDDQPVLALRLGEVHGEVGVAQQRAGGAVRRCRSEAATPTLPWTVTGPSSSGTGSASATRARSPTARATSGPPWTTTANSSPPMRATTSPGRTQPRSRSASDEQQLVAGGVAAAVVDVLEVVEVDEQHAHRAAALQDAVGDLLEQGPVGQPGQRVAEAPGPR